MEAVNQVSLHVKEKELGQSDLLFTNRHREPYLDSSSLNKTLTHYCSKAGIDKNKNITCHSFRHMYATRMIKEHDLETARKALGHQN